MMKAGLFSLKVAVWNTHTGTRSPDVSTPMRLELPEGISIQTFVLGQRVAYGVGANGEVYIWGSHSLSQEQESTFFSLDVRFLQGEPREFASLKTQRVSSLSCNSMVAFFVTKEGVLYSYGNDLVHKFGILAQNDIYSLYSPIPVRSLSGTKIKQVSVGNSHACASSTLGALFVWGEGRRGQLGLKGVDRTRIPTQIPSFANVKQAWATSTATIILTGGGYTYISGTLRSHFPDSSLWAVNRCELLTEPREIESLTNKFVVKISHGEESLTCLTKEGEVIWVSADLTSYKMGAKHIIKDIQCVESKIFGMTEEGKHLYEWLPTLDERKTGDLYTISTCNYKTHIFEIEDQNLKYIGFCDVTSGHMAAMYFISHCPREATLLKPGIFEQNARSQPRRRESPTPNKEFHNKFKRTLAMNSVERSGERNREGIAQKTFHNELSKKKTLFPQDVKGEFKAGVEAFKEYLSVKRLPRTAAHSSHPSLGGIGIRLMEHPLNEDASQNANQEDFENRKKSSKNCLLNPQSELSHIDHSMRTKQRLNQLETVFKRQLQLLKDTKGKSMVESRVLPPDEERVEQTVKESPSNQEIEYSNLKPYKDENSSFQNSRLNDTSEEGNKLFDKQEVSPSSNVEPLIPTREEALEEISKNKGMEEGIIREEITKHLQILNQQSLNKRTEDGASRLEHLLKQAFIRTGFQQLKTNIRHKQSCENLAYILEHIIKKNGFLKLQYNYQQANAIEKINFIIHKKLILQTLQELNCCRKPSYSGIKTVTDLLRKKLLKHLNDFSQATVVYCAREELEKANQQYEDEKERQNVNLLQKDFTIKELQSNIKTLSKYKDSIKNVALRLFLNILVNSTIRLIKNNFTILLHKSKIIYENQGRQDNLNVVHALVGVNIPYAETKKKVIYSERNAIQNEKLNIEPVVLEKAIFSPVSDLVSKEETENLPREEALDIKLQVQTPRLDNNIFDEKFKEEKNSPEKEITSSKISYPFIESDISESKKECPQRETISEIIDPFIEDEISESKGNSLQQEENPYETSKYFSIEPEISKNKIDYTKQFEIPSKKSKHSFIGDDISRTKVDFPQKEIISETHILVIENEISPTQKDGSQKTEVVPYEKSKYSSIEPEISKNKIESTKQLASEKPKHSFIGDGITSTKLYSPQKEIIYEMSSPCIGSEISEDKADFSQKKEEVFSQALNYPIIEKEIPKTKNDSPQMEKIQSKASSPFIGDVISEIKTVPALLSESLEQEYSPIKSKEIKKRNNKMPIDLHTEFVSHHREKDPQSQIVNDQKPITEEIIFSETKQEIPNNLNSILESDKQNPKILRTNSIETSNKKGMKKSSSESSQPEKIISPISSTSLSNIYNPLENQQSVEIKSNPVIKNNSINSDQFDSVKILQTNSLSKKEQKMQYPEDKKIESEKDQSIKPTENIHEHNSDNNVSREEEFLDKRDVHSENLLYNEGSKEGEKPELQSDKSLELITVKDVIPNLEESKKVIEKNNKIYSTDTYTEKIPNSFINPVSIQKSVPEIFKKKNENKGSNMFPQTPSEKIEESIPYQSSRNMKKAKTIELSKFILPKIGKKTSNKTPKITNSQILYQTQTTPIIEAEPHKKSLHQNIALPDVQNLVDESSEKRKLFSANLQSDNSSQQSNQIISNKKVFPDKNEELISQDITSGKKVKLFEEHPPTKEEPIIEPEPKYHILEEDKSSIPYENLLTEEIPQTKGTERDKNEKTDSILSPLNIPKPAEIVSIPSNVSSQAGSNEKTELEMPITSSEKKFIDEKYVIQSNKQDLSLNPPHKRSNVNPTDCEQNKYGMINPSTIKNQEELENIKTKSQYLEQDTKLLLPLSTLSDPYYVRSDAASKQPLLKSEEDKDNILGKDNTFILEEENKCESETRKKLIPETDTEVMSDKRNQLIPEEKDELIAEEVRQFILEDEYEYIPEKNKESIPEKKDKLTTEKNNDLLLEGKQQLIFEDEKELIPEEEKKFISAEKNKLITEEKNKLIQEEKDELIAEEGRQFTLEEKHEYMPKEKKEFIPEEKNKLVAEEKNKLNTEEQNKLILEEDNEFMEKEKDKFIPEEKNKLLPEKHNKLILEEDNKFIEKDKFIPEEKNKMLQEKNNTLILEERNQFMEKEKDKFIPEKKNIFILEEKNQIIIEDEPKFIPDEKNRFIQDKGGYLIPEEDNKLISEEKKRIIPEDEDKRSYYIPELDTSSCPNIMSPQYSPEKQDATNTEQNLPFTYPSTEGKQVKETLKTEKKPNDEEAELNNNQEIKQFTPEELLNFNNETRIKKADPEESNLLKSIKETKSTNLTISQRDSQSISSQIAQFDITAKHQLTKIFTILKLAQARLIRNVLHQTKMYSDSLKNKGMLEKGFCAGAKIVVRCCKSLMYRNFFELNKYKESLKLLSEKTNKNLVFGLKILNKVFQNSEKRAKEKGLKSFLQYIQNGKKNQQQSRISLNLLVRLLKSKLLRDFSKFIKHANENNHKREETLISYTKGCQILKKILTKKIISINLQRIKITKLKAKKLVAVLSSLIEVRIQEFFKLATRHHLLLSHQTKAIEQISGCLRKHFINSSIITLRQFSVNEKLRNDKLGNHRAGCRSLRNVIRSKLAVYLGQFRLFASTQLLLEEKKREIENVVRMCEEFKETSEKQNKEIIQKEEELRIAKTRESALKIHHIISKIIKSNFGILKPNSYSLPQKEKPLVFLESKTTGNIKILESTSPESDMKINLRIDQEKLQNLDNLPSSIEESPGRSADISLGCGMKPNSMTGNSLESGYSQDVKVKIVPYSHIPQKQHFDSESSNILSNEMAGVLYEQVAPLEEEKIPIQTSKKKLHKKFERFITTKPHSVKNENKGLIEPNYRIHRALKDDTSDLLSACNPASLGESKDNTPHSEDLSTERIREHLRFIRSVTPSNLEYNQNLQSEYYSQPGLNNKPASATNLYEGLETPRLEFQESRFQVVELLNSPETLLIEKSRLSGEENSTVGMADPFELDSPAWSGRSSTWNQIAGNSPDDTPINLPLEGERMQQYFNLKNFEEKKVGRYNHQRFMNAFSNCFVKYHNLMLKEENDKGKISHFGEPINKGGKFTHASNDSTHKKRVLPKAGTVENKDIPSTVTQKKRPPSEGKVGSLKNQIPMDASKLFKTRVQRQKNNTKKGSFVRKNIKQIQEHSERNSVLNEPMATSSLIPKKTTSMAHLGIRSSERSRDSSPSSSIMSKWTKKRPSNDFMEINKQFIKEMSSINHEINGQYSCQAQVPRFKVPKPDLVFNYTRYKTNALSTSVVGKFNSSVNTFESRDQPSASNEGHDSQQQFL